MTPEQKAALKTYIQSHPDIGPMFADGNLSGVADGLNAAASPAFYVWRTEVSQDEIMQNGFDWVRVDNLTPGKARIWEWMFDNATRATNPSKLNVREGIKECWKGTAADEAVRLAVYQHCQRLASRLEKVFAAGIGSSVTLGNPTGTSTGVGPGSLVVEGPISYTDLIGL